jgi:hypothetical protein
LPTISEVSAPTVISGYPSVELMSGLSSSATTSPSNTTATPEDVGNKPLANFTPFTLPLAAAALAKATALATVICVPPD